MTKRPSSPKNTKKATSTSKLREAAVVTVSSRPVRANRGIGGQQTQLEKASAIVGEGLFNKVTAQKRGRSKLVAIPENVSENDMAPPIPTKRARISKAVVYSPFYFVYRNRTSYTNCLCDQIGSSVDIQNS
jgi:hypothetical protein